MKKLFTKAKLEIKFRKAGGGHALSEDKTSQPSTSQSNVPASRAVPTTSAQRAGEAALQRINQHEKPSGKKPHSVTATWKHDTKTQTSTNSAGAASSSSINYDKMKTEVRKEVDIERSQAAALSNPAPIVQPPEPAEVDSTLKLSVDGIYFKCPYCPMNFLKKDKNTHLQECLEIQYSGNPHTSAAFMIQSLNSDQDKVKACIDILCRYIDNICNNPGEEKFMKIKQSNKVFQDRVACITGAVEFIVACGFEDKEIQQEDKTENFYVIPSDQASDKETLQTHKAILISTEPIKPKLDRNLQVYKPTCRTMQFELPEDFFSLSSHEVKREYHNKLDDIDKSSQLKTKAMREAEKKPTKTYRFTLIRVRFPDGTILQGTFYSREKLRDLFAFVRESLVSDWQPFVISDPTGQLKAEDSTLNELGLVPAAVVNFAWDANIMADIIAASGSVHQDSYLKPDLMAMILELV